MTVKKLENGVVEYETGRAVVRIHPGKLTEEQRKAVLENAAKEFFRAIQKAQNGTY